MKGYKVVQLFDNQDEVELRSFNKRIAGSPASFEYKVGEWTHAKWGSLAGFNTYYNAVDFLDHFILNADNDFAVYEMDYSPSKLDMWYDAGDGFRKYWHNDLPNRILPHGTVLCDSIKLTKKVY